jgi:hypothetical protein
LRPRKAGQKPTNHPKKNNTCITAIQWNHKQ